MMKTFTVFVFVITSSLLLVACGAAEAMDPGSVSIDTMGLPYSWQPI